MAGFLIPFGRTIGEMGAGFGQGENIQQQAIDARQQAADQHLQAQQQIQQSQVGVQKSLMELQNLKKLQADVASGKVPAWALYDPSGYFKAQGDIATQKSTNATIANNLDAASNNEPDPLKAAGMKRTAAIMRNTPLGFADAAKAGGLDNDTFKQMKEQADAQSAQGNLGLLHNLFPESFPAPSLGGVPTGGAPTGGGAPTATPTPFPTGGRSTMGGSPAMPGGEAVAAAPPAAASTSPDATPPAPTFNRGLKAGGVAIPDPPAPETFQEWARKNPYEFAGGVKDAVKAYNADRKVSPAEKAALSNGQALLGMVDVANKVFVQNIAPHMDTLSGLNYWTNRFAYYHAPIAELWGSHPDPAMQSMMNRLGHIQGLMDRGYLGGRIGFQLVNMISPHIPKPDDTPYQMGRKLKDLQEVLPVAQQMIRLAYNDPDKAQQWGDQINATLEANNYGVVPPDPLNTHKITHPPKGATADARYWLDMKPKELPKGTDVTGGYGYTEAGGRKMMLFNGRYYTPRPDGSWIEIR